MLRSLITRPKFQVLGRFSSEPPKAAPPHDVFCDPENPQVLQFGQISSAAFSIRDGIMKTECRHSYRFSKYLDMELFLKMELNQVTGSFKERGARSALLRLTDEQRKAGVWAASAGNHALALCYHGGQLNVPINVVMPRYAPLAKIDFCSKLGANIMVQGKDISVSREIALEKAAADPNAVYINGYDHIDILAGAGTVGLEIMDQVRHLDAIVIPVGGGGLIAGMAVAIKTLFPDILVIGVEAEECPSFSNALKQGKAVYTASHPTLADGLAVPTVGVNAYASAKGLVDKIVTVSEQNIALAILRLVEWEKVITEGAGATCVAALLSDTLPELKGKRVACVLSGGNIDSTALGVVIERGMVTDIRLCSCNVVVSDRPGGVAELAGIIGQCGGSIKSMYMDRTWLRQNVFSVMVKVTVETRNAKHADEIKQALKQRYEDVDFKLGVNVK
ncbi:unnamed protein product [Bursaphelenchus okinawaensis]|uniref:Serine racemase n=1 Tax=Bursaphelenchus okinawaensis TaxID=465554 RepID=A0A811L0D7_9BILA|nr:unnamed protein product [Bursaphelenchus okinawaensis]CAG9115197.1 unnamed protein product [Bursaphelenchus okinawaensis]